MVKLLSASHSTLRWLRWLWSQEGTPGRRARGVAAGVFCGCYPFFGLRAVFSIGIASLVRGNHLLAAAGPDQQSADLCPSTGSTTSRAPQAGMAAVFNDLNRSNLWQQGGLHPISVAGFNHRRSCSALMPAFRRIGLRQKQQLDKAFRSTHSRSGDVLHIGHRTNLIHGAAELISTAEFNAQVDPCRTTLGCLDTGITDVDRSIG